jgi:MvaI/BcnI restriction endonuclease family
VPGISDLPELRLLLAAEGVRTAWVKKLSPRQDNEKNQIYLGGGLDGVTNIFPTTIDSRSASQSVAKRAAQPGRPKLEARLDFAWLGRDGTRSPAPGTRIIDYFQYPELRLSGFLAGCGDAPDALRRERQALYGQRWLVMGTADDGQVLGLVLTERDDPLAANFPDLPEPPQGGVLRPLVIDVAADAAAALLSPFELLRAEMAAIIRGGWHTSRILKAGGVQPFSGAQGGGYTLEALLGVAANGNKAPDRHGFEVKSFSGSRISLMTPTPDYGFQGEHSFREFMARYGRPGQKDDGSLRFVGIHRCGQVAASTGLAMRVTGFNSADGIFDRPENVGVELYNPETGEIAAGWSLEKLANCWNAKHANALYIASEKREGENGPEYRYADRFVTGAGTDVWKLLRAIARGLVFYDPADTIYADGKPKVRSQWRINASQLPDAMASLYGSSQIVTV